MPNPLGAAPETAEKPPLTSQRPEPGAHPAVVGQAISAEAISMCRLADDLHRNGRYSEALAAYDRAIGLFPRYPAALNNRGVVLLALKEPEKALESFGKAIGFQPDFALALYNRGNALRELRRTEEALADYERATAMPPRYAPAFNNRGATQQELGRPTEALDSYNEALAIAPSYADAIENKAVLQSEFGDIAEAREALETLLSNEPRRARAHFHLVRMKRMTRNDPQLATLERLAQERGVMRESEAIDISFALGKAYDDLGEYERAFACFTQGNALKRAEIVYNEAATIAHFHRISATFTADAISALRNRSASTAAPIFIFGMPRSGSTLIEQILSRHQDVSARGEIDALDRAVADTQNENNCGLPFPEMISRLSPVAMRAIAQRYLQGLGVENDRAIRTTDKKPSNFLFAGLIHLALPNARLIHTRRHPVDTCWSCFSHRFGNNDFASCYDLGELGRFYCAYASLMEHWRRTLPADAMLTVDYEDVVADVEGQTRRILDYCGLTWSDDCLSFQDSRRHVATASAEQVRRPLYRDAVGRGRHYAPLLGPLIRELRGLSTPGAESTA